MKTLITQERVYEDRGRRLMIALLQLRIDRCMKQIRDPAVESGEKRKSLRALAALIGIRNELYTDSEIDQIAKERGLA